MRFTRMENYFNEFMAMDIKVARVDLDPDDYKSVEVARTVLYRSAKMHGFPIKISIRRGELYFVRTDME